ncbi:MAG TPA: hypothetical protein VMT20_27940 [Terriglobia bacterium]|nr:hypothetical protein [Terriglobia bacterium]
MLQPAVIVQPDENKRARRCAPGKPISDGPEGDSYAVSYGSVNGSGKLSLTWRFEEEALWLEPVVYESPNPANIVALHYFAQGTGEDARPTLDNFYLIIPGICESPAVSPIVTSDLGLNLTSWLGRGSSPAPGLLQQWGLPAHFFCGFHRNKPGAVKSSLAKYVSEAFCCGLAELPTGDLFLETRGGKHSLIVSYRSDIWEHLQAPGRLPLGARLHWAIGPDYREAIKAYYKGLVSAGAIRPKSYSPQKTAVVLAPQFNCWGAEVAIGKAGSNLDEAALNSFYTGLRASGMKAGMFVIDDKWEGKYGKLEHSADRLPHFEEFRRQVREDGLHFGLWAAFMRCQDPADMGLNISHMLHLADGKPCIAGDYGAKYYILDFTQPEVERALRARAKRFAERYQPDLVKFDFGYELPPLSVAAPKDMNWAGERLMLKGLDVVVNGMREANPDIVVMYYCLSPLLADYFDLHSPDDLFMAAGEYDYEANRRFFFSSLLGEIGIPTYGSGGYDWATMPSIWFDSALTGTLGSLNSFVGDEEGEMPTPRLIAKYNGLVHALRTSNIFTIEPGDADYDAPTRGAHSASWARFEQGKLVGVALRTYRLDGRRASGRFRDVVETTAPVVISSITDGGIVGAANLAIVPYGQGEVIIHRASRQSAEARMIEHYFGGNSRERSVEVREGALRVPLSEQDEEGSPVEWIEVNLRV